MDVLAWKAWYRGGQAYCSPGQAFEDLPDDGVLGIVILFDEFAPAGGPRLRRIVSGSDLYWSCDLAGHWTICQGSHEDQPLKRYPGAVIKHGAWTSDEEMQRVNDEMRDWYG